jgi:O-succinylbenzoate synthase
MGDLGLRSAEIRPYQLTFSDVGGTRYGQFKKGRIVRLVSDSGITGYGDASPLAGFSTDSVDDVDASWTWVTGNLALLDGTNLEPFAQLPPSLLFGIEQALLSIEGQRSNTSAAGVISAEHRQEISINGLIDCHPAEALARARLLIDAGCSCIKFKVAGWDPTDGVRAIKNLRAGIGSDVAIRLDANRAWSYSRALRFLSELDDSDVSYIEEPLIDSTLLGPLSTEISVPLAIDESIVGVQPGQLCEYSFAEYVIVKPTILGGIRRSLLFAKEARSAGMSAVISSSLESGLGTLWLVALSASTVFDPIAGLDAYRLLDTDVLNPKLQLDYQVSVSIADRVYESLEEAY